jgi:hypothetical protein
MLQRKREEKREFNGVIKIREEKGRRPWGVGGVV